MQLTLAPIFALLLSACAWSPTQDDTVVATGIDAIYDLPCQQHLEQGHGAEAHGEFSLLHDEIIQFQDNVERALTYRAATIDVAQRLKIQIAKGAPLNGADLDTLNNGMIEHLALRDRLLATAKAHECWLFMSQEDLAQYGVSREARYTGVMLSLSAALVLYDNYLLAISVFEEDTKLRRILNEHDSGYGIPRATLASITLQYNSAINRARVRAAMRFIENERGELPDTMFANQNIAYLEMLLEQSPSYDITRQLSPLKLIEKHTRFFGAITTDSLVNLSEEGINLFSLIFGNATGLIETRKGKLYQQEKITEQIRQQLRAGDILLEKTPFRLTDKFIPGHWGHVAMWIGNEDELRELGIWDHPIVRPYQKDIQAGRRVVEALRKGVVLNPIDHFLNIDDLAVLRSTDTDSSADAIILALRQIGKAYDFNFNVETTDRIVCSELVYLAYTRIDWPTERMLGRATISPDNVAKRALDNGPLKLVLLYHDGERIDNQPQVLMAQLMNEDNAQTGDCKADATGKKTSC
ncbi:MAG TPA: YiiX/YebB-like N1pC/P60 family cysteine hydrolase [Gammaproteobacteria bacterium]